MSVGAGMNLFFHGFLYSEFSEWNYYTFAFPQAFKKRMFTILTILCIKGRIQILGINAKGERGGQRNSDPSSNTTVNWNALPGTN
jgi:hypothetical protein